MKGYGQFCPIAKASEILCERWVPLVLREIMYGSARFNDIARGVPLMSRGLLAGRLRLLRDAGVVQLDGTTYRLTASGEALRPILDEMGQWAQRWGIAVLTDHDVDDRLLIWHLRRTLRLPESLHGRRVVVRFDFYGLPRGSRLARRSWWLVAEHGEVDLCYKNPGHEVDVTITADVRAFLDVLLGHRKLADAARSRTVRIEGDAALVRVISRWIPEAGGPPLVAAQALEALTMQA
ncbi:MAG TPA: winged helix-turn-helix transcriptional regulator [Burkholderiales bacterium]|nr:winged helix-turn-helix transcriptional regulator [Burkholderiales bacterium]